MRRIEFHSEAQDEFISAAHFCSKHVSVAAASSSRWKRCLRSWGRESWRKRRMSLEPRDYLRHILVEADYLISQSRGISVEELLANETLRRAFPETEL